MTFVDVDDLIAAAQKTRWYFDILYFIHNIEYYKKMPTRLQNVIAPERWMMPEEYLLDAARGKVFEIYFKDILHDEHIFRMEVKI